MLEVRRSTKGPQIFVSRTHKGFLKRLFELEVPEIHSGTVEIKAIAREAGSRSKVAVASRQDGLDPVGATVGQRGARVQAVVAELSGEKIDVIPWSDDASVFVANALSPAQVISVDIDEEHRIASVTVPERMLSLAIGREGQNARLAARLTGWRIDIRSDVSVAEAKAAADAATRCRDATPRRPSEAPSREAADGDRRDSRSAPRRGSPKPRRARRRRGRSRRAPAAKPKRVDRRRQRPTPEAAPKTTAEAERAGRRRRRRRDRRAEAAAGRQAQADTEEGRRRDRLPRRWRRRPRPRGPSRRGASRPDLRRLPDGPSEARAAARRPDPGRRRSSLDADRSRDRPRRLRLPDRPTASTRPSPRAPSAGRSRPRSRPTCASALAGSR